MNCLVWNLYDVFYSAPNPVIPALKDNVDEVIYQDSGWPKDIFNEVLKYDQSNLVAIACVCKQFTFFTKDYAKKNPPIGRFGAKEWKIYCGDVEDEPTIPLKMYGFNPEEWMLTLVPETINQKKLTLTSVDRFVSDYKNGIDNFISNYQARNFYRIKDEIVAKFKTHWVLLSKDILEGTKGRSFETQEGRIKAKGFEIPYLIDLVVSHLMHYLSSGNFIDHEIHHSERTYTRVEEVNKKGNQIIVGCRSGSLYIGTNDLIFEKLGIACAKRSTPQLATDSM